MGTDIVHSVIIKAASVRGYWQHKQIDWPIVGWLAIGSAPTTFFTARLVGHSSGLSAIIKPAMGIMLLIAAALFLLKSRITRYQEHRQEKKGMQPATSEIGWKRRAATVLIGAGFGIVVALTSVGSGTLIMISLAFLYPRMGNKTLVGTDIAQALILLLAGSAGYLTTGIGINWQIVGWLLVGSLPVVFLGGRLSGKIPQHWLTVPLAVVLAASGLVLLIH